MIASIKSKFTKPRPSPSPVRPAAAAPKGAPAPKPAAETGPVPDHIELRADLPALAALVSGLPAADAVKALESVLVQGIQNGYLSGHNAGYARGWTAGASATAKAVTEKLATFLPEVWNSAELAGQKAILAKLPECIAAAKSGEAPVVNVHNEVVMPQRAIRASPQPDGSTLLVPEGEPIR
jgi:hypothetical protein